MVATDAITVFPICAFVNFKSSRTTAIKGAIPNQATKHRKNANQERWNARIGPVLKSSKRMLAALPSTSRYSPAPISEFWVVCLRFDKSIAISFQRGYRPITRELTGVLDAQRLQSVILH